jgi:hypothetical protein
MTRRTLIVGGMTLGLVFVGGGSAAAVLLAGNGADPADVPVTGTALERASEAALAHTGEGEVVEVEVDDDAEGYYEVEVRLDDGTDVEVNLGEDFTVLGEEDRGEVDDD